MFKDGLPALVISTVLYLLLSQWFPLNYTNSLLSDTIHFVFQHRLDLMDSSDYRHRFIAFESIYPCWPIGLSALAAAILAYTNQGLPFRIGMVYLNRLLNYHIIIH